MHELELFFVVPTYRLRDVGETIKQYDEHFWRNGHSVRMLVLNDSSPANQEALDEQIIDPGEPKQTCEWEQLKL